jgi:hypothetical protein
MKRSLRLLSRTSLTTSNRRRSSPAAFWEAMMEQMCCQLDKNVPLPPCVEPATVTFIRTYGCNDDEIPSSIGRKNFTINVSTQRGTQWSPESLSGNDEDNSKANILLTPAASAKYASGRESDEEELRIPNTNEFCTDGPVHKSPEFHKTLRACIRQLDKGEEELNQAIEVYKKASWRTPTKDNTKSPTPS